MPLQINPSWDEADWNRHKLARLIDSVKETLDSTERFEEVTASYDFGCWTITAIPRIKIPETEPGADP